MRGANDNENLNHFWIMTDISLKKSHTELWQAAIKLPMYTVAVIPITVGTAIAFAETGNFDPTIFSLFLSAAILIVAWLNLSNDVFDAETGIDKNKAHSVVNLTGKKNLIFWLGNILLAVAILEIITIATLQKDMTVLGIIFLSCFLGYTYQGPPFRLGYQGLGEIICFVCFGPLALAAAYYSQTKSFSSINLAASMIIGVTTSIILFCSHFHQVEDDLAAGKLSPIVRLGTERGARVLLWFVVGIFLLNIILIVMGFFPPSTLLILISLPFAYDLVTHVSTHHNQAEKVSNSKFIAVKLHFFSGLLLAIGFIMPPLI
jgi:1,4-dihydroxy-2-naphthoate octaprenyltransferase